jgi:hypothetical protein
MGFNSAAFDRMLQLGYPLENVQKHFSLSQRDFATAFQEYQDRQIKIREQAYENATQLKEIWIRILTLISYLAETSHYIDPKLAKHLNKELDDLIATYAKTSIFNGPITMCEHEEPAATVGSIQNQIHKEGSRSSAASPA